MRREKIKQYEVRVQKFLERLNKGAVFIDQVPLEASHYRTSEPVAWSERLQGDYQPVKQGDVWGSEWDCAWFHITGRVPAEWKGLTVVGHLDFNGELCLFDDNGCPTYGLTSGSIFHAHFEKNVVKLFDSCQGGEVVDLWADAGANHMFGLTQEQEPAENCPKRLGSAEGKIRSLELCAYDEPLWHFIQDIEILDNLRKSLPENHPRRNRILKVLSRAIDLHADDRANVPACRELLATLSATPANASDMTVTAVGHAHIDTGWLWPVRESIRKCARTFSSQIANIERYPGYVFGASQPQHYQFVKDHYPALYEKIKAAVAAGSWELQGGMWVEADCNIIGGESMVRQFLHGKNFFRDEFGQDVRNLWLPDVFGYSAAMPQIMQKAGVDFFLTQKISWSQFNEFPHNTFKWRGIDGTEVVTHFPPENNYNGSMLPEALNAAQCRFKENSFIGEFMSLFGIGNGGGGPKEQHIERALRMKDLEGAPKVTFGRSQDFFDRLLAQTDELETWFGELYLETHRGTLTTQAKTKKNNRRLEQKLRVAEIVWSCLPLDQYPQGKLDKIWKTLLMNQFHDIIPGSSINRVYQEAEQQYADALEACDTLIAQAADQLLQKDAGRLVLFNSLTETYTAPVALPASWKGCQVLDEAGNKLPVQDEPDAPVVVADIPPQTFLTLKKGPAADCTAAATTGLTLENELVRYEFAEDGTISQAYDKATGSQILSAPGNVLSLYGDRPNNFDAWDVDCFYEEQFLENAKGSGVRGLPCGDVRQGLEFIRTIGKSTVTQKVTLTPKSRRLDFETTVDWRENHRMLRVAFPTTIMASQASFDIQYGYIKRNTHRNDQWDMAKFEVAAHKYVDISDLDYGVALLNDCKYGHKVHDGVLDLNLLRAPTYPDPDADRGIQTFTYSLLPHTCSLVESDVMAEACMLNVKPLVFDGHAAAAAALPCTLKSDAITLEVLKKAEKEECHVVRLVETKGRHSQGVLTVADTSAKLVETNLMEWTEEGSTPCEKPVAVTLKPFEIRTYLLK
jgi:alpha-mannosidase